jgi:hypothetical protein
LEKFAIFTHRGHGKFCDGRKFPFISVICGGLKERAVRVAVKKRVGQAGLATGFADRETASATG